MMQARAGQEDSAIERAASVFPVLGTRLEQRVGSLSGGEQQMLAMVRAYIRQPKLLLVDEPSLGLGPLVVEQIFTSLCEIATNGTAILVVDQFATKVLELAERAYVLTRGKVAWSGAANSLEADELMERYLGT
jgi:branched-chain amino acid transport system ATP-binding protein